MEPGSERWGTAGKRNRPGKSARRRNANRQGTPPSITTAPLDCSLAAAPAAALRHQSLPLPRPMPRPLQGARLRAQPPSPATAGRAAPLSRAGFRWADLASESDEDGAASSTVFDFGVGAKGAVVDPEVRQATQAGAVQISGSGGGSCDYGQHLARGKLSGAHSSQSPEQSLDASQGGARKAPERVDGASGEREGSQRIPGNANSPRCDDGAPDVASPYSAVGAANSNPNHSEGALKDPLRFLQAM